MCFKALLNSMTRSRRVMKQLCAMEVLYVNTRSNVMTEIIITVFKCYMWAILPVTGQNCHRPERPQPKRTHSHSQNVHTRTATPERPHIILNVYSH